MFFSSKSLLFQLLFQSGDAPLQRLRLVFIAILFRLAGMSERCAEVLSAVLVQLRKLDAHLIGHLSADFHLLQNGEHTLGILGNVITAIQRAEMVMQIVEEIENQIYELRTRWKTYKNAA